MVILETKDGKELKEVKENLKNMVATNEPTHNARIKTLDFIEDLEKYCEEFALPFDFIHVVSDEHFPEFIRTKWQELYIKDNADFGTTPFGHLINWQEGIEESQEDYYRFTHDGVTYWVGV